MHHDSIASQITHALGRNFCRSRRTMTCHALKHLVLLEKTRAGAFETDFAIAYMQLVGCRSPAAQRKQNGAYPGNTEM